MVGSGPASGASAQNWVDRTQRPSSNAPVFPAAAPDGGPLVLADDRLLAWNGSTWREVTTVPPTILGVYDIAGDTARGRTVVLGITSFVPAAIGVAEWDGATWTTTVTAGLAAPLVDVCFDPALGGVVALTQPVVGTTTQDYLWSGTAWTALAADVRPRHVGAMTAPDPVRGRLVAFAANPGTGLAETHEWDGTTWSLRSPANSPGPRESSAMAFDPAVGQVLMFGGRGPAGALQDGWHWNGVDWTPAVGPAQPVGSDPVLVLDRTRAALMLLDRFGGDRDFVRAGAGWSDLAIEPKAATMTVHDVIRNQLVSYAEPYTYGWDGNTWARIAAGGPGSRSGAAVANDISQGALVMFGGVAGSNQVLGDTWTFDGAQWTQQGGSAPPARSQHALVMHAGSASVILFGGLDAANAGLADTWQWQSGAWTDLTPGLQTQPPPGPALGASSLQQDPAVVAGGQVWRWNGAWASIALLPPTGGPYAFWARGLGFTPAGNVLLTGSSGGVSQTHELVNTTWVAQPAHSMHLVGLANDPLRGNVIAFDGSEMHAFTATPAGNATVGTGCGAPAPALYSGGFPRIGNAAHQIHADGLSGLVLFAVDTSTMTTPLGNGCDLHLRNPLTAAVVQANGAGIASIGLPLPAAPWLRGLDVFVQAAGPQAGGPYLGLAVSAGLRVRVGD